MIESIANLQAVRTNSATICIQAHAIVFKQLFRYCIGNHFQSKKIRWSDRLSVRSPALPNTYVLVGGVDFKMQEPTTFSLQWYSHKFRGPSIKYEWAMYIHERNLGWIRVPFLSGSWPGSNIFNSELVVSFSNHKKRFNRP